MKTIINIIGNGTTEIAPSFILNINQNRYYFNFPENTTKCAGEKKTRIAKNNYYFLTTSHWKYTSEYLALTLKESDPVYKTIPIHIPSEFQSLFTYLDNDLSSVKMTFDETIVINQNTSFIPIKIIEEGIDTLNYIIKLAPIPGKIDMKKILEKGIDKKFIRNITNEGFIKINDVIITREEVSLKGEESGNMMILHIPTMKHLQRIIERIPEKVKELNMNEMKGIIVIASEEVLQSNEYKNFISPYKCEIILMRDSLKEQQLKMQSTTFIKHHNFNLQMKDIYPQYVSPMETFTLNSTIPFVSDEYEYQITPVFKKLQIQKSETVQLPKLEPLIDQNHQALSNDIKLTFLGCGGAFPSVVKDQSSYLLEIKDYKIIVDCGNNLAFKLMRNNVSIDDIDLVYITHFHFDHVIGLFTLLFHRTKPLTIIGPIELEEKLNQFIQHYHLEVNIDFYRNSFFSLNDEQNNEIDSNEVIRHNQLKTQLPFEISTMEMQHSVPNYAVKIIYQTFSIVFTGDTYVCEQEKEFCRNVTFVVHDCNYESDKSVQAKIYKHSTPKLMREMLNGLGIGLIFCIHVQPRQNPTCITETEESDFTFIDCYDGFVCTPSLLTYAKEYNERMKEIMTVVLNN